MKKRRYTFFVLVDDNNSKFSVSFRTGNWSYRKRIGEDVAFNSMVRSICLMYRKDNYESESLPCNGCVCLNTGILLHRLVAWFGQWLLLIMFDTEENIEFIIETSEGATDNNSRMGVNFAHYMIDCFQIQKSAITIHAHNPLLMTVMNKDYESSANILDFVAKYDKYLPY